MMMRPWHWRWRFVGCSPSRLVANQTKLMMLCQIEDEILEALRWDKIRFPQKLFLYRYIIY